MNSVFVTRKEFSTYKECCYNTAIKHYKKYLQKSGKTKDMELTTHDLSRIDNLPIQLVANRCGKN